MHVTAAAYSKTCQNRSTGLEEALTALRFKCWVVTHRAAFMGTAAGLGVIEVSSGVVRMVYR